MCGNDSMCATGKRQAPVPSMRIMTKRPDAKPEKHRAPAPPQAKGRRAFTLNPRLGQQTRKVLSKHYRAKYGVK